MDASSTAIIVALISLCGTAYGAYTVYQNNARRESREDERSTREELRLVREELGQVRALLISSPSPEWRKDEKRRYIAVSPAFEISVLFPLNMSENDVIGKTDEEVFARFPDFVRVMREVADEAQRNPHRVAVRRKVCVPGNDDMQVIIKEIAHSNRGPLFLGKLYRDGLFAL